MVLTVGWVATLKKTFGQIIMTATVGLQFSVYFSQQLLEFYPELICAVIYVHRPQIFRMEL